MAQYYFLGTALPPLRIGAAPDITFNELDNLLKQNLNSRDYAKTKVIRRYIDIQNIRSFWLQEELDPFGNLDEVQLEDALFLGVGLPSYVYTFLEKYEKKEERLKHFPQLLHGYFRKEIDNAEGFLKEYLEFEREWRLVMVGFRAKNLGRDVIRELEFENPDDPIVYQILAQKDSKTYVPPEKYSDLKTIFEQNVDNPLALHQALTEYRFNKIESMLGFDLFSIDRILGYLVQYMMVEKWHQLNKQKGIEIVDKIIKEAT